MSQMNVPDGSDGPEAHFSSISISLTGISNSFFFVTLSSPSFLRTTPCFQWISPSLPPFTPCILGIGDRIMTNTSAPCRLSSNIYVSCLRSHASATEIRYKSISQEKNKLHLRGVLVDFNGSVVPIRLNPPGRAGGSGGH